MKSEMTVISQGPIDVVEDHLIQPTTAKGARLAQLEAKETKGSLSQFETEELAELRGYDPADAEFAVNPPQVPYDPLVEAPKPKRPRRAAAAKVKADKGAQPPTPDTYTFLWCTTTGIAEPIVGDQAMTEAKKKVLTDDAYMIIVGRPLVASVSWE